MCLALAWVRTRTRELVLLAAAGAVMAGALVVTYSRSSALMLMVGLVLLAIRAFGPRRALVAGAVLVVLAGGIAIATSGPVRHALTDSNRLERVSEGRFDLMRGGLTIWREEPVVGAGLGGFQTRFEETLTPVEQRRVRVVISHNSPITVLSEGGVIGFALFLALLVGGGWAVVRGSRDEGDIGWARWTLGAILAGIMVHSLLYAAFFEDPVVWVAAGAAVALALTAAARPPEAVPEPGGARGGGADVTAGLRVLCLSNMWPGPVDPDYGAFVAEMCGALEDLGMTVDPVVIDRRGGRPGAHARQVRVAGGARGAPRPAGRRHLRALPVPHGGGRGAGGAHRGHPLRGDRPRRRRAQPRPRHRAHRDGPRPAGGRGRDRGEPPPGRGPAGHRASPCRRCTSSTWAWTWRASPPATAARRGSGWAWTATRPWSSPSGGSPTARTPSACCRRSRACAAVRPDARVAFVGDGPLARAVDVGAARMGLEDAVIRTGALPHERVADWVAACDMLAMVSRVEPLGVVALEALAGGRPVVATRVGGTREVVPAPRAGRSWTRSTRGDRRGDPRPAGRPAGPAACRGRPGPTASTGRPPGWPRSSRGRRGRVTRGRGWALARCATLRRRCR